MDTSMETLIMVYVNFLKKEKEPIKRICILFTLIDLYLSDSSYNDDCYIYAKEMVQLEFDTIGERKYGYDQIKIEKYLKLFEKFPSPEKISILEFLKRQLLMNKYNNLIYKINDIVEKENFKMLYYKMEKYWWIKMIIKYPSLSLANLLKTFLFLFIIYYLVLLPAPIESFQIISIANYEYDNIINHFFIVLGLVCCLFRDIFVIPVNNYGVFILIVFKGFSSLYIIGYLFNEFKKRINIR